MREIMIDNQGNEWVEVDRREFRQKILVEGNVVDVGRVDFDYCRFYKNPAIFYADGEQNIGVAFLLFKKFYILKSLLQLEE